MMDEGGQLRPINPHREVMLKRNFCGLSLLTTMAVSYEFAAFIQINIRIGALHDGSMHWITRCYHLQVALQD